MNLVDHQIRRIVIVNEDDKYLGIVEQEEIIFEFESGGVKNNLKMFELLLNESKAIGVDKDTTLDDTIKVMREKNFGSILVKDGYKSIGILTESDIVRLAKNNIDKSIAVKEYMHSPIFKVPMSASMEDCIKLLKEKKIRRIIVEDEKVEPILKAVADVACTETKGDGKVFVSNIEEVMDICSKECGHKVL